MRQKRLAFFMSATLSAVVVAGLAVILLLTPHNYGPHIYKNVAIGSKTFNITALELNQSEWERGLMNTTVTNSTLALFEFNQTADWPFWMYDTYNSLDMIWINYSYANGSGTVVYIAKNATSCFDEANCTVYDPQTLANFVVEAKAGFSEVNNVTVGEEVSLK